MTRKILALVFLTCLAAVLTLLVLSLYRSLNIKPTSQTPNIVFSEDQKILESQIKSLIEEANYCNSKEDCIEVSYGCPFGCSNLINKQYDTAQIEKGVEKYNINGRNCLYKCMKAPSRGEIDCINNKCVDKRFN